MAKLFGLTPNRIFAGAAPVAVGDDGRANPVAVLVRLFFTGGGAEPEHAEHALSPLSIADLEAAGIVAVVDGRVVGRLIAIPWDGMLLFGDGAHRVGADYVAAATLSSIQLAMVIARRPVTSTLDVGTGSGVQGLLASRHSDRVIATDVNPRALEWARLNAKVNGVANVELREGSWFEPAEGGCFDLITANLPYAISPDTTFLYRDSGLPGDELGRMSVRQAADHLADGGFAYLLCDWVEAAGAAWTASPRSWVEGTGCDALILRTTSEDVAVYAYGWLRATGDVAAADAEIHRWLAYYRELGIERVGNGAVVLRRRGDDAAPWFEGLNAFSPALGPQGDQVMNIFAGVDAVRECADDGALMAGTYAVVEPASLDQTVMWREGTAQMGVAQVSPVDGMPFVVDIPADVVHVLLRLDPRDSLDDTVEDTAEETGIDVGELRQQTADAARRLLTYGLLRPMPH